MIVAAWTHCGDGRGLRARGGTPRTGERCERRSRAACSVARSFPGQFKSRTRLVRRTTGRRGGPVAFERRSGKAGWKAEQSERLDHAVNALRRSRPELSAAEPIWFWQKITAAGLAALVLCCRHSGADRRTASTSDRPRAAVSLRYTFEISGPVERGRPTPQTERRTSLTRSCRALPTYSVLVPLFREAAIVPDLVAALAALDYPRDRLEILLILEGVDHTTQAAVRSTELPAHMSVLVVPDGEPRTKPRALNYALTFATGDYVVVYDAEDLPEPGQLRLAVAALTSTPRLGCVQARPQSSTIPTKPGSRANSPSNTPRCSTACCRRWNACVCQCRSAGHQIIFPGHFSTRWVPGTPST